MVVVALRGPRIRAPPNVIATLIRRHFNGLRGPPVVGTPNATHEGIGERVYGREKEKQFHIKWQHWPINRATWEPEKKWREDMDAEPQNRSNANTTSRARKSLRNAGSSAKAMQAVEESARPEGISPGGNLRERPILYLSRTLRSYEKNYTILELELGAVVWSILKLQRYLDGVPFTVVTDHQPILQVVSSNSKTLTSPRVERWRMLLQPCMGQMTFIHKAGKKHLNVSSAPPSCDTLKCCFSTGNATGS
jgi:hypothetical protein